MLTRKFSIRTNYFKLPQGTSPTDEQNVQLMKRIIKSCSGAEEVDINFLEDGAGNPLVDQIEVHATYPEKVMGKYVSLGAIQGEQGNILAEVIKAMSTGGDAKGAVQRLLDSLNSAPEEGLEKEGPPKPTDSASPSSPGAKPPAPPAGGGLPSGNKPRMPFAGRQSRLVRAMKLESKMGIPLNAALEVTKLCERTKKFSEALPELKSMLVDAETDQPLPMKDYVQIAKIARGQERQNTPLG